MHMPGRSCGEWECDSVADGYRASTLRRRIARTLFLVTTGTSCCLFFHSGPDRFRPNRWQLGVLMPTTTSSVAAVRERGVTRSVFGFAAPLRITYLASTQGQLALMRRARRRPLDFESAAPSRSPTERSASPTTGSKEPLDGGRNVAHPDMPLPRFAPYRPRQPRLTDTSNT